MKNAVLCAVLGISLIACSAAYDYISTENSIHRRLEEKNVYAELNADMHRKYGGYSIEELCEKYTPPSVFLGKSEIPMEVVDQYPELPVGCEVTCAAAMLRFFGYGADKCSLTDDYLPTEKMFTEKGGVLYGPDPHKCFVGDPYGKGYGCYKEVIAEVLDSYFADNGSPNRAVILDDPNSADLERLIDGGVPVIVWASIDMKPYRYNAVSEWITDSGDTVMWLSNSHTLILTGYDASYYYFMDCNRKDDIQRYTKQTFIDRWEENGKQSIVVKIG